MSSADATRGRLRDAAVAAFAERGFHGTSTRDIAMAAGMSPAALYVHHSSKEQLLYELSSTGHRVTRDLCRDATASADSPTEKLRALVRAFVKHHAEFTTSARIVNYEMAALTDEHRAEILEQRTEIDRIVRDLVDAGIAAGEFDVPSPHLAATALLSLGIDIARWYRPDGAWPPDEIAEGYAAMALRIVGAREAPNQG